MFSVKVTLGCTGKFIFLHDPIAGVHNPRAGSELLYPALGADYKIQETPPE